MDINSPEYKRVREEIARTLYEQNWANPWESVKYKGLFYKITDAVLSINGIAILSDDQNSPLAGAPTASWQSIANKVFKECNFKRVI